MAKLTFVSAALIAAAVSTTQAMAARSDASRHTTTKINTIADCVRAPNVGRVCLGSL